MDRLAVPLGGPLELTIRFDTAPDMAPIPDDFRVLLHYVDPDGALLWADDHEPPRSPGDWQPAERIEYSRRSVVPMYPYIGDVTVALGLYSPTSGERLPLAGVEVGERTYSVATLTLEAQPETAFLVYGDGWYRSEFVGGRNWRWTADRAFVQFRNPRADTDLTMHLAGRPGPDGEAQRVALAVSGRTVHELELESGDLTVVRQRLSAGDLGQEDVVELEVQVDPTFRPAERDADSTDSRDLGVRVFYLFVEPR